MVKGQFFLVKLAQNWPILEQKLHFLRKLQKSSPLRARNFEKVYCKGMIFHENSLHCKGPILEGKFWAERMVVFRSSDPPRGNYQVQTIVYPSQWALSILSEDNQRDIPASHDQHWGKRV